ncbi:MAG: hypothetical protein ACI4KF_00515 [Huintestinicola sp.]
MGACDFSAVFSEICSSIAAGESVSQVEKYSLLFDNYYLSHKDEAAILDKSDINKRKQGKMNAHSGIIKYYCQDPEALAYDIETNIIPLISDKYALRDTFINMVKCDSCSEEKKADTLADTDDLPQFFANVIIHSFGHNSVQKNASPDISDRIISSVPKPCKTFSGREKELEALHDMLQAHDKIFVYGIGGIGKSEFVKAYISEHKKEYKNILYLTYESNLRTTIAEISFKDDVPQETIAARFKRHSEYLKLLKTDSLIVIDNFDILPHEDEYLDELLSYSCRIIFTTRNNFGNDYDTFELADIDRSTLFEIAEKFGLTNIDYDILDRIFAAAHDHTLACELIIRLLKKSAHTPNEILEMLMTDHVNIGASDKIRRSKTTDAARYSEHIRQLFRLFSLSEEQQDMMRLLSLIPVAGISDKYFQFLTATPDCNIINELDEIGLIRYEEHLISVHPLIGEAAAFDLSPDMDNCVHFIDALDMEYQHHLKTPINNMRQEIILEIADRIVEFAGKDNVPKYFEFLTNAAPYAEVFADTYRMEKYISQMEEYLPQVTDILSKAVYLTIKASYAMLYGNDADSAIEYETQALSILHDYPDSYREAVLCFNIYNSLGAFFTEKKDFPRAKLCLEQARTYAENFDMPLDDVAVLFHNLSVLELESND